VIETIIYQTKTNKRMKLNTLLNKSSRLLFYCLLCAVLLSTSCQKLKYGDIVEKWYEPANSYFMLMPMIISNGKTTSTIMIPYYIYDNEDWCIKVTGIGTKGDTITRTFYVDKITYDTLSVGNFICVDGKCDEDENNTKVRK
jgi:hypothetical protein